METVCLPDTACSTHGVLQALDGSPSRRAVAPVGLVTTKTSCGDAGMAGGDWRRVAGSRTGDFCGGGSIGLGLVSAAGGWAAGAGGKGAGSAGVVSVGAGSVETGGDAGCCDAACCG